MHETPGYSPILSFLFISLVIYVSLSRWEKLLTECCFYCISPASQCQKCWQSSCFSCNVVSRPSFTSCQHQLLSPLLLGVSGSRQHYLGFSKVQAEHTTDLEIFQAFSLNTQKNSSILSISSKLCLSPLPSQAAKEKRLHFIWFL